MHQNLSTYTLTILCSGLVCSRPRSAMLLFQTMSSFPMSVTFFICRTSAETLGSGRRQYKYWRTSLGPIELTGPNTLLHTSPASSSCGPSLSWSRADWAAWHLPGGPVGPPVGWAATSNAEGRSGMEEGEGAQRPLAKKGELYLDKLFAGPEFLVTSLPMGPVCLVSHSRFEQPVCP